ncbi:MAG TPA: hypothetical protein VG711_09735, partial [Phycisphaerales bacterium]|nr:hypothetical protein [Phycisphaerales bacterium]
MSRGWSYLFVAVICLACAARAQAEGGATANEAGTTSIEHAAEKATESPAELPSSERLPLGRSSASLLNLETADDATSSPARNQAGTWGQAKELLKVGGALVLVLGLIFLTKKAVGGRGMLGSMAARPSGVLEILARYPVGKG